MPTWALHTGGRPSRQEITKLSTENTASPKINIMGCPFFFSGRNSLIMIYSNAPAIRLISMLPTTTGIDIMMAKAIPKIVERERSILAHRLSRTSP